MSRTNEQLLDIIGKQANLVERLTVMLGEPVYLALYPDMRKLIQQESTKAVLAARRVIAEEATT